MSELRRQLTFTDATLLTVGVIIGGGIFVAPNLVARQLPSPPWIMAAWLAAGVLSLFGALAFAELGSMFPAAGGQFVYLREAWGPLPAFLSGWTGFLVIYSGALAWLSVSFAAYLGEFVTLAPWGSKLVSLAIIAAATLVNALGARAGAKVQDALTVIKIAGLAIVIGAAFLSGERAAHAAAGTVSAGGFGLAMVACLLSYDGWVAIGMVAGEIRDPQRTIPRALFAGIGLVVAAYLAANFAYLRLLTPGEIAATDRVGAMAASRGMGAAGGAFLAALTMISVAGSCNGWMLAVPRMYYAMARDGVFFAQFAQVHQRFGTPARAIVMQGLWAALLAVSGTYEALAAYAMFATWIFYGLSVLGVLRLRRARPDAPRPYRMWGYPLTPLLFCTVAFGFVLNTLVQAPRPSFSALGLIAAGLPAYWFWHRKRSESPL